MTRCTRYSLTWTGLKVTCGRSEVISCVVRLHSPIKFININIAAIWISHNMYAFSINKTLHDPIISQRDEIWAYDTFLRSFQKRAMLLKFKYIISLLCLCGLWILFCCCLRFGLAKFYCIDIESNMHNPYQNWNNWWKS